MDPKVIVMKSKSSNSAISKKSDECTKRQCNKKTRSNVNFTCRGLKKRGVYVEKRLTRTNLNTDKEVDSITQKPPPRPRPGQKKFLASVLSILSKSTTGTQYPEIGEDNRENKLQDTVKGKAFFKRKKANGEDVPVKLNDSKNTKEKFKSRVLNKKFVKEDKKKMVVLQSKKEIAQTPSNYSDWSYRDGSQYSNYSNVIITEDSNKNEETNVADELKNAILEGRNVKVKKLRYLDDEPKTLVSDAPAQKNLYSFFVDLIETTISVYNVKAEYDTNAPSEVSKTNLEINESVADKLNINKTEKTVEFEDGTISPQHLYRIQNDTDYEIDNVTTKNRPVNVKSIKRRTPFETAKARNLKADSFLYSNNLKAIPQKSKSVDIGRKTTFRNKNDLINVLKQELEVETDIFEEPKSIFQALKVMARNKKRISFDPSIDHKTFTDECILKRRKVISSRKVKKNNKDGANKIIRPVKPIFNNTIYLTNKAKPNKDIDRRSNSESDVTESYHSLEVYGFDYEPNTTKLSSFNKTKDLTFTYHSSPSNSDLDFDVQDAILNSASTFSTVCNFSAVVD